MIRILRGRCFYITCFISFFFLVIVFTSRQSKEFVPIRLELPERKIPVPQGRADEASVAATTDAKGAESAEKEEVPEETHRTLTLKDILRCGDTYLDMRFEYYGNFVIFNNYIKASKEFGCHESITLSAPGDFRFLDNIEPLLDRWRGPISVALYAPGYDFHSTIRSIAYLRQCRSELIKEYVTFHLFFEHNHFPNESVPLVTAYKDEYDCSTKPPYETVTDQDLYKSHKGLTYPINLARNIAKVNVQTHFVFPSDIELYPTRDFIPKFLEMVMRYPQYVARGTRNVFVLPIFEVLTKVPESKTELVSMLKDESAILFHKKVCALCHRVPDDTGWLKAEVTDDLNVFTAGKRHGRFSVWEPFFVCTQKEPLWDERFNWEGQSNKMVQAYHMCMQDYNFLVLDNAFLTHKPGVKKKKVQVQKFQDQILKNTHYLDELAKEVPKIYGENPNCKVRWQTNNSKKKSKETNVHEFFERQQERRHKIIEDLEHQQEKEQGKQDRGEEKKIEVHNEESQQIHENVPQEEQKRDVQEEEEKRAVPEEEHVVQNRGSQEKQENKIIPDEEKKGELQEVEEKDQAQEVEAKKDENNNQLEHRDEKSHEEEEKLEGDEEEHAEDYRHEEDVHQNEQAQHKEENDEEQKSIKENKQVEGINDDRPKNKHKEDDEKYDNEY